jgi:hypothetical protein
MEMVDPIVWPNARNNSFHGETNYQREAASVRMTVRLRPVEKKALLETARLLKQGQDRTVSLAITHLSETLANGLPVYVSLPPHEKPNAS